MELTPEQKQIMQQMTPEQIKSFASTMTPDQAQGLIAGFSVSILNDLSVKMERDVKSLKLLNNMKKSTVVLWINDVEEAAGKVMLVKEFTDGIEPCIKAHQAMHDMKNVDAYLLEIRVGFWKFEIYGSNSKDQLIQFDLSPIQIVPFIK